MIGSNHVPEKRKTGRDAWLISALVGTLAWSTGFARAQGSEGRLTAAEKAEKDSLALLLEARYPSATTCRTCHPDQYREWSVSSHAYAQLSPVFNAMQATTSKLTNGTNGDFCIRCHTQVGMNAGEEEFKSNMDRFSASREGVTCIVCHRLEKPYGKVSGRLAIVEGDIFHRITGPTGNEQLKKVIESGIVNTERGKVGLNIHTDVLKLEQLREPGFCSVCHDVNLVNGFRLEEAFSDFKTSPASGDGTSCQDCHMGLVPGKKSGYAMGPAAIVNGTPTAPRRRTNHMFAGPDYSVIHPGIFPHNTKASALAEIRDWLTFKYEEGWGSIEFEKNVPSTYKFPDRWKSADDRRRARLIIRENLALLDTIKAARKQILSTGYQLGAIDVDRADQRGISFDVEFKNATDGHSVPTGFDAERVVFLRVTVTDSKGDTVFKSGDLDPNGDLRDEHSLYVHNGELPIDDYLFSLQSRFLVRMVRGGEREQILPINYSPNPSPFLRPSTSSTFLLGRPTGARKHREVIPPLSSAWATYEVDESALTRATPPYKATVQIVTGMVPINLINEIKDVGFDYFMTARDIARGVLAGHLVVGERQLVLKPGRFPANQ